MTELDDRIAELIAGSERDLDRIEHTLTDGYAHALRLEAEIFRLEKQINKITRGLHGEHLEERSRELSLLAERLAGNAGSLLDLRARLRELRRHAAEVRAQAA